MDDQTAEPANPLVMDSSGSHQQKSRLSVQLDYHMLLLLFGLLPNPPPIKQRRPLITDCRSSPGKNRLQIEASLQERRGAFADQSTNRSSSSLVPKTRRFITFVCLVRQDHVCWNMSSSHAAPPWRLGTELEEEEEEEWFVEASLCVPQK